MSPPPDHVEVPDRAAWRRWLERNHARRTHAFLVFWRKGTGHPSLAYDEAVEEALCFGWIDGVKHKLDDQRYTYRFSPRRPGSNWSAINQRRAKKLITAGLMTPAGRAAIDRARADGSWRTPRTTPVHMPGELAAAFQRAPDARRLFAALTPARRLLWQRWVADAKQSTTRARRAASAIIQLRAGGKQP
jgi:uncharacterized protein YdeI (YjbR/CyaY-like superfamily)